MQWIKTETKLPPTGIPVLVTDGTTIGHVRRVIANEWKVVASNDRVRASAVVWWMNMPELPENTEVCGASSRSHD